MQMNQMQYEEFNVIGIQTRTTNALEFSGAGKIGALWGRFFSEQIASQIPQQIDQSIFAVYHNYENEAQGEYSILIGMKVKAGTVAPNGLTSVKIPAQSYMRLTTHQGEMPNVVIDGWKKIWELTEKRTLNRNYSFDFELYDHRSQNPKSSQVDIYISTK